MDPRVAELARTLVDLFAGLGGFSLAASWHGVRPVAQVEIEPRCRAFLNSHYGDIQHEDIRQFDGRPFCGAWLLAGGPPCQPASRAGKQRGAADDRWLWPEALRVLSEVRPAWALFENPPGIGDVFELGALPDVDTARYYGETCPGGHADVGQVCKREGPNLLDQILGDIESLGYAVQTFAIPACAVNSPQIRMRYWIVANAAGNGRAWPRANSGEPNAGTNGRDNAAGRDQGDVEDAFGWKRQEGQLPVSATERAQPEFARSNDWTGFIWTACADGKIRRSPDGSERLVNGLHRSILGALGNSIVPQVAAEIIAAMIAAEDDA